MALMTRAKGLLDVASTIAILAVAAVMLRSQLYPATASATTLVSLKGERLEASRVRYRKGTAKPVLVEFADFECPYCAQNAAQTLPAVEQALIDTGRLSFAFVHYPLGIHPHALRAGAAAECAGRQGRFWPMHDILYKNQKALDDASLVTYARSAGVEAGAFEQCMASDVETVLTEDRTSGTLLGVTGTPHYFLGTLTDKGDVIIASRIDGPISAATLPNLLEEATGTVQRGLRWPWSS